MGIFDCFATPGEFAPMDETLRKIARLYDLVGAMRGVIKELEAAKVTVRIGREARSEYDFNDTAVIHIELQPGCDLMTPEEMQRMVPRT